MLDRFRHTVEDMRGLIDDSQSAPFLLAVSGGMDSMCLADLWVRAFGADTCAIAHCNFNLRGEDSRNDETLVTDWAHEHGARLHKVSFDTVQYASENSVSIEMAARELRYKWFGQLCSQYGYPAVVTAHHADDNAETMILNMVRGAGLKGISGMSPVSALPYAEGLLLRPLLTFTRKQIDGHVFAWKVPYREDKTNSSVIYRRNSIRHEVFPVLERMNPSYVRTLNREMAYFKDACDIVDDWCRARLQDVLVPGAAQLTISTPALSGIPQWRYLLYYILEPYGFNSSTLESLESLLTSGRTVSGKRFESDEYLLLTERQSLVLVKKVDPKSGHQLGFTQEMFIPIRTAGAYHIGGSRIVVETLEWNGGISPKQSAGTLVFDADKLKFPFVCRKWRAGDWMIPFGMKGKKKLSDLFTDLKYTHLDKESALVVVDCRGDMAQRQHVAAVLPVRIDDHYKVTSETKKIIKIRITDN